MLAGVPRRGAGMEGYRCGRCWVPTREGAGTATGNLGDPAGKRRYAGGKAAVLVPAAIARTWETVDRRFPPTYDGAIQLEAVA